MIITEEHIRLAEQAGACSRQLEEARGCVGQELTNSKWASWYAISVVKGRCKGVEKVIAKNADDSFWYSYLALNGRFVAGEKVIAKSPHCIYLYACYTIRGRFSRGEEAVTKSPYWDNRYREFLNEKL